MNSRNFFLALAATLLLTGNASTALASDPLPSWNEGDNKAAIMDFVEKVTAEGTAGFVPPAERVATFDNDGTLWAEQPMYFQALFILDRIRAMAPDHPEWADTEPYKSAIAGDMAGLVKGGMGGLMTLLGATHAGVTAEEFEQSVSDWLASARHPKTGMPFNQMVYQPMLELLDYLRANGFKTFIASAGGVDFMRVFAEQAYGIPPEQVVGSSLKSKFEMRDGIPTIVKTPDVSLIDDNVGKPVGIYSYIGHRPILAGGNSDGDLQMLQYTTIARNAEDTRPRLGILIHHTDSEREYAYDRGSHVGGLDKAMDEAPSRGWLVIDMARDWSRIFPD